MQYFKADLHTHTVLSPCGSLEMSPERIVEKAQAEGIDLLGITDHNSTLMCNVMQEVAAENNIKILPGAEVATREEVHCLAFFEHHQILAQFQEYLETYLPHIHNNPLHFGHQVVTDRNEQILKEVDSLLIVGIEQSITQVETKVHELNGIFIPAHIDRASNSLISQLGFIPPDIKADAMEISKFGSPQKLRQKHAELSKFPIVRSSDAHFIDNIGDITTQFYLDSLTFNEIRMALKNEHNRKVIPQ